MPRVLDLVDRGDLVRVLTHDPKLDIPPLNVTLRLPLAYIGAMGSRRTNDDRLARLRELAVAGDSLRRMRAPIGLDIAGRTSEETALSIAVEIVASRWGGTGQPLCCTLGPIHRL